MLYQIRTTRTLAEIDAALRDSAARHAFGVIATHDLKELMKKKGVELDMACLIYEVCNPVQAKKALETDGAISTALPCRVSIYGQDGAYTLATMLPTELMKGFDKPGLETVARDVEEVVLEMMQEAAGARTEHAS